MNEILKKYSAFNIQRVFYTYSIPQFGPARFKGPAVTHDWWVLCGTVQVWSSELGGRGGGASGFPEDGEPAGMGRDEHREDLQMERQARLCRFQAEFGI